MKLFNSFKPKQEVIEEKKKLSRSDIREINKYYDNVADIVSRYDISDAVIEMSEAEDNRESFKAGVSELAGRFHDDWRNTRLNKDGSFEPRMKTTTDEAWIEARGSDQVDIANTEFNDLPQDWQEENVMAAKVVINTLESYGWGIDLNNPAQRSGVGNAVHEAWLKRNPWADESLKVPFDELSPEEQDKDIAQIRVAKEIFDIKDRN